MNRSFAVMSAFFKKTRKTMDINSVSKDLSDFITSSILAEGVGLDKDTNLKNVGVDSFSLIEIVLFIEQHFGVTLPENQLSPENFESVSTLADCLMSLQGTSIQERAS